jgi:hypothetical protein
MNRFTHLDAAESAFFERELEYVKTTTYDVRYPNLMARTYVPVSNEAGAGALTITYRQFDEFGKAKVIGANAKDLPRVDIAGTEFPRPVREVGAVYAWNLKEVRSAMMAGRPLNSRRAATARRAIEELLDYIACFGSPKHGIIDGFLNSAAVTPTPAGDSWQDYITADTKDLIVAEVAGAMQRIVDETNGIFRPTTVLIPELQHALIATTPYGDNSDKTILDFMLANFAKAFPGFEIKPWYRLKTAGAASVTRMVTYARNAEVVQQDITNEFEQLPVQEQGLEFVVNCWASTAGTQIPYPGAVDYVDGI